MARRAHGPCSRAPLSLRPRDQAAPRCSTPSPRLTPSPPPRHTRNKATSPPNPTNFPAPPSHLSGARRNCRPGGSSGRPPSSLLAFSSLTGEGLPQEGEARSRGGRRSGRSARSCFQLPRERRKKGARQGSARAAALPTAPLCPALARRQRRLPSRRLLPRRPASPRRSSFSPFLSRSGAGIRRLPRGSSRMSPCARTGSSLGVASRALRRGSEGPRVRPPLGDPGRSARKTEASWRGKTARRHIPMGFFPCGGREATSDNIGTGVVGTTFCGSARRPPAPLFVRTSPADPGGAAFFRRLPPGRGSEGPACRGGGAAGPCSGSHADPDTGG